jgi:hypothetical protein
VDLKFARKRYYRNLYATKAESAVATLAVEVGVQVIEMLTVFAAVAR